MKWVSLVVTAILVAGCLPTAQSVVQNANLEVVVTGLMPGDGLSVAVDDDRWNIEVPDSVQTELSVYAEVAAGAHVVSVDHERGAAKRCGVFAVEAETGQSRKVAVDIAVLDDCAPAAPDAGPDAGSDGGPGDAGVLDDAGTVDDPVLRRLRLREDLVCDAGNCEVEIELRDDGELRYTDADGEQSEGQVSDADFAAIATVALSFEADALFAEEVGACTPDPGAPLVELRRQITLPEGEDLTQTVEIQGCEGVAEELRARLLFLVDLEIGL